MTISPELDAALEKLAGIGPYTTADALLALQAAATYRDEVWPHLTPTERYVVLRKLRRLRERNRRAARGRQLR